jgi:hypothetical protein
MARGGWYGGLIQPPPALSASERRRRDTPSRRRLQTGVLETEGGTAVCGGQLRHGAFTLHGFQRHACLEARVMVPAFAHALISRSLEISRRHIVASVTVRISGSTSMLPPMVGAPACYLQPPVASLGEPLVIQLTAEDGRTYVLPLCLAAGPGRLGS